MSHLTDEQLTCLIYDELSDPAAARAHLKECVSCQQRFEAFGSVTRSLNEAAPGPAANVDVRAILEPSLDGSGQLPSPRIATPHTARRTSGFGWLVAAAALALVAAGGFWSGSWRTGNLVQQEMAAALQSIQDSQRELADATQVAQRLQQQIKNLETSFEQNSSLQTRQTREIWKAVESRLGELLVTQVALQSDLQTLAVNAEGEIQLAQREIRRIDEFVSTLLSFNQ